MFQIFPSATRPHSGGGRFLKVIFRLVLPAGFAEKSAGLRPRWKVISLAWPVKSQQLHDKLLWRRMLRPNKGQSDMNTIDVIHDVAHS